MQQLIDKFTRFYEGLGNSAVVGLDEVYHSSIEFTDPIHHIKGLQNLARYFDHMMTNATSLEFKIDQVTSLQDQAFIEWTMLYCHPKLSQGKPINVTGISHIKFADKVHYHRDYYDIGEMVYEHVPFLGSIIRKLKNRLKT